MAMAGGAMLGYCANRQGFDRESAAEHDDDGENPRKYRPFDEKIDTAITSAAAEANQPPPV